MRLFHSSIAPTNFGRLSQTRGYSRHLLDYFHEKRTGAPFAEIFCSDYSIRRLNSFSAPFSLQGFYLLSPSEFERFSISASNVTEVCCALDLAEGSRPSPNTPTTPTPEVTTPNGGPKADVVSGSFQSQIVTVTVDGVSGYDIWLPDASTLT